MGNGLRVLIVDGDVICRDAFRRALEEVPDIAVVGAAPSGKLGLERLRQQEPDMVILDTLLADMSPCDFADAAFRHSPQIGVLLASSLDPAAVERTIAALEHGAFDFFLKQEDKCPEEGIPQLRRVLLPKIRCFSIKRYSRLARGLSGIGTIVAHRLEVMRLQDNLKTTKAMAPVQPVEAVLVGVSTGGPEALLHLLAALPPSFPVPIVIVLHMPPTFTTRLAEMLNRDSLLTVREAADGDVVAPGVAYLAPGGMHLSLTCKATRKYAISLSGEPSENGFRPCVNRLFRSAAEVLGSRAIAVVLTGMGNDGTEGARLLKAKGATILAQDEASSVVWGMPGSVVRAGLADEIVPLAQLADRLVELTGGAAP